MAENSEVTERLPEAVHRFVLHWGNMGDRWGVTRSVSQVQALLYVSDRPLTADDIADKLNMARSNVSTSLRELMSWNLVRRVPTLGDRKDYFEAETDLWTMVQRIAAGRKSRELDPAAAALRECIAAADKDARVSPEARKRLAEMSGFLEQLGGWYEQMLSLPRTQVTQLMKLGSGIARLLDRPSKAKRAASTR
jgi:DNA-binding transcriptional regulator GbsR (MarR family)